MSNPLSIQAFAANILNKGTLALQPFKPNNVNVSTTKDVSRSIASYTFDRFRHDVGMWREAVSEAEQGFIQTRYRVKMQRMFLDTVLNEHVFACLEKRRDLTLLKECVMVGPDDVVYKDYTPLFASTWFEKFLSYVIDSRFYGYSLISLGDVTNGEFKDLKFVPRENISPDRYNVARYPWMVSGVNFLESPIADWCIYVSTPTENGKSPCGYGLLYKIAKTEILLRNNTAYNADYNEMYGQPIRKGKTSKMDEGERANFFQALLDMAHNGAILLDEGQDDVELIQASTSGSSMSGFENFEKRLEAKISKVILGHADALDSTPGKLGAGQNGDDSPVNKALAVVEAKDMKLCETVTNNELLPRLRKIGFNIPEGLKMKILNNKQDLEIRTAQDNANQATANIALAMSQAGLQMDMGYFEGRTGIKTTMIPKLTPPKMDKPLPDGVKNKLERIYNKQ